MTQDQFWAMIESARQSADQPRAIAAAVIEALKECDPDEIVAFTQHLSDRIAEAYRWDLWAVAYIINGGCSDDGFEYFRAWLVAQGRERFHAAMANPEAVGAWASAGEAECEELLDAPWVAFEDQKGEELPFHQIRLRQPASPRGVEWDEESVGELYPELAKRFG